MTTRPDSANSFSTLSADFLERATDIMTQRYDEVFLSSKPDKNTLISLEESVGGFLCRRDVKFDSFEDDDFFSLTKISAKSFLFFDFNKGEDLIFSMGESRFTLFFVSIDGIFFDMAGSLIENHGSRPGSSTYWGGFSTIEELMFHTLNERRQLFYGFLNDVQGNPGTPIELLLELM